MSDVIGEVSYKPTSFYPGSTVHGMCCGNFELELLEGSRYTYGRYTGVVTL
jgi:hypothetical protein